jgi:hypothetical protein
MAAVRNLTGFLKKTPQRGELNNLLSRQNGGDQFTLRSGVNFIQMSLRHRFRREMPYAFAKSAFGNDVVRNFARDRFVIQ